MNILLINHYAGSPEMGMEYRPYYLAQEWIKLGHNITFLVANNSHLRFYNPDMDKNIKEELIDKIKYVWVKTSTYNGNGIGRIRNIVQFVWKTYFNARLIASKYNPDVVIASSTYPSDNYVAKKIAKIANAKYLYEVHDLWPLSPMELGQMSKNHPFIMMMQHAENYAYKNTDAVVSMLPKTKKHMEDHGLVLRKWNYIPNGVVVEQWNKDVKIPQKHSDVLLKLKDKFIVGYAGGHASSNSLDTLVQAAEISQNNDVVFVLVGDGTEKQSLLEKAKKINNILFLDPVNKKSIPDLLSYFNIGIIGAIDSTLYRFGVSPNKLFDYMMAKIPVIQYINAGNDIVKEAQAGISVESGDPQAIVDAIAELNKKTKQELEQMGKNGQEFVLKNHDYKILAKKFINIIEKL